MLPNVLKLSFVCRLENEDFDVATLGGKTSQYAIFVDSSRRNIDDGLSQPRMLPRIFVISRI
jgi:hypothetical protein